MDDESKADTGLAVQKSMPARIDEHADRAVFDLPEDDPDLFDEPAKERIRAAGAEAESSKPIIDDQAQQWVREGIPTLADRPPTPHRLGRARPTFLAVPAARTDCPHCEGRGFVPGINDHLRESAAMLTAGGAEASDILVRDFYVALFREAPNMVAIFPGNPVQGDFGSNERGAKQRELLLSALVSLSELYDPGNPERMSQLDAALKRFGRAHAAFARPDGTVSGATLDEYKAVKDALFSTLVRAAADKWRAEYTIAWSQAYDYAAAAMLLEQHRSQFTAPRYVRG